ncbi:hypothetical protein [Bacteroides acidifaciens]|uniref:hypothetical protein n=2 Tax=Bacteroidia TaxID=200643 RepID=UPI0025B50C3A|nr:hypothetical protein [Bacteroides acidifaciens]
MTPLTEVMTIETEQIMAASIMFDESGNTGSAIFGDGHASGEGLSKDHLDLWGDDEE